MSKAKFDAARELIQEKRYDEARALLASIDHPTAREWEAKINRLAPIPEKPKKPAAAALPNRTRGLRIWRNIWGILALLSLAWMCYGLTASSSAFSQATETNSSETYQAGAAIGASMGIGVFICTGLPFLLIFLFAYGRAGASIRSERQHRETIEALQGK